MQIMVATVIRREVRRYFGSVCKNARGHRWTYPLPWGECVAGLATCRACREESGVRGRKVLPRRRRRRGLRKGRRRSRGGKPPRTVTPRPPESKTQPRDREIKRASAQLDFWGKRLKRHSDIVSNAINKGRMSEDIITRRGNLSRIPTLEYRQRLRSHHLLMRHLRKGSVWLRPMVLSFSTLVDSLGMEPFTGQVSGARALLELAERPREWLRFCRDMEIDPSSKELWDRYWSPTMRSSAHGSKTGGRVGKPSPSGAPLSPPGANTTREPRVVSFGLMGIVTQRCSACGRSVRGGSFELHICYRMWLRERRRSRF